MATIQDSWRQIDGGMRYAVRVGRYTVTVDTERGQYTGFVRLSNEQLPAQEEKILLKKAIAAVRRLYSDDTHNPEECDLHIECIPYGPKTRRHPHWDSGLGAEGYLVPEDTQLQRRYADPR